MEFRGFETLIEEMLFGEKIFSRGMFSIIYSFYGIFQKRVVFSVEARYFSFFFFRET